MPLHTYEECEKSAFAHLGGKPPSRKMAIYLRIQAALNYAAIMDGLQHGNIDHEAFIMGASQAFCSVPVIVAAQQKRFDGPEAEQMLFDAVRSILLNEMMNMTLTTGRPETTHVTSFKAEAGRA